MATKKEATKKGSVVIVAEKMVEILDKQGIKRKELAEFEVSANGFSSVQWYGVKITSGNEYYIAKAIELGAEKK